MPVTMPVSVLWGRCFGLMPFIVLLPPLTAPPLFTGSRRFTASDSGDFDRGGEFRRQNPNNIT